MDYPEEKQRIAVAKEQWNSVDRYNASNYQDGCIMLSGEVLKPTDKEQKIKVFPKGSFYVDKYKKDIEFNTGFFGQIASAFNATGLSKPKIDKDHEFKTSFGDINSYDITDDGMYFNIKLNPKGVELVKSGEYNYISPAWGRTKATDKMEYPNRLLAVSLVNFPALEGALPSLQEQLRLSKFEVVQEKKKEAKHMELYALAKELGLNSEASIDAIHSEVLVLKSKVTGYETETVALNKKCKDAEDTAIKLSQELKDQKTTELKKEAFEAVKNWVAIGKVHPAVQDIVINRYVLNKEDTVKEIDLIPEKVYLGKQAANGDTTGLSEEDSAKMLKAGLDPKDKEDVQIYLSKNKGGK